MGVVEILSDLVRINSVNPEWGGPGERKVADYVLNYFEQRGIEVWESEVLPGRPNVTAKIRGENPDQRIVLEAHMDTVSVDGMEIHPFDPVIRDGKLYGRGSVDIKSGLAAMMHAVATIENPPCEVWLAAVIDEEHAYRGVLGLLDELPGANGAIVAEPTGNRIVSANKGVLRFTIKTKGVAAHSSKPHLGSNAIYEMAKVIERIEMDNQALAKKSHPLVGEATCCVGTIAGGTQVNIVPDSCEIKIDRRMLPGETGDDVIAGYEKLLSGLEVDICEPDLVDEAMETSIDESIVTTSAEVMKSLGGNPAPVGVPFGCDATKISRAGIPSIIFGPGSIDQAHAAVEFVDIEELATAAEFYTGVIRQFGL